MSKRGLAMSAIAGLMSAFGYESGPRERRKDDMGHGSHKSGQAGHKRRETAIYLKGYDVLGHPVYAESRVSPMKRTPFHGRIKGILLRDIITGR